MFREDLNARGEPSAHGRTHAALRGTRWMAGGQLGVQALRLGVQMVLARLLAPDDFGLVAMALVITNFLDIIKNLGLAAAIVQRQDLSRGFLNGVFFLNIVLGAMISAVLVTSATGLAALFSEPRLVGILQVLAVATFISALATVPNGLLIRGMRFRKLAGVQLVNALSNAAVAVPLAVLGYGAWSIVIGVIVGATSSTVVGWRLVRWWPSPRFRRSDLSGVWTFSINLSASEILFFLTANLDKVIIGAVLGPIALGLYTIVQRSLMHVVRSVTGVLHHVLFATFADAQSDDASLRRGFLRVSGGLAFVTFPIVLGAASVADPLVGWVLGTEWRAAAPLFALLAPVAVVDALGSTTGVLFKAKGRTDLQLYWAAVVTVVTALSYWIGLRWGINGVATAYSAAMIALVFPALYLAFRLIGLRFVDFFTVIWPHVRATVAMVVTVFGVRALIPFSSPAGEVMCAVLFGAGAYLLVTYLQRPTALEDIMRLLLPRLATRNGGKEGPVGDGTRIVSMQFPKVES